MFGSDLVISAAGTTLYELYTLGVPTIVVPIVENQLANAKGYEKTGIGKALIATAWDSIDVAKLVGDFLV